jgi:cytochrome c-type biogenesis protein CcsB
MLKWSELSLIAALLAVALAVAWLALVPIATAVGRRITRPSLATAGGVQAEVSSPPPATGLVGGAVLLAWLGFGFVSAMLVLRAIALGHGPFANMYEFSVACAWGVLLADLALERRTDTHVVSGIALPVALVLLLYAVAIAGTAVPLPPALQNGLLLTAHVAVAIVAYATLTIAFAAAALLLVQTRIGSPWLPAAERLDRWSHRAVTIAFPFLTLVLVLGAVWAEVAWGSYWSWDPKETAALATWLIYAAYLHGRAVRGWRDTRCAWLVVLGFVAVIFTFSGNLFFGGLHAYSGLR